jgi:short-subunit dehydrogenase
MVSAKSGKKIAIITGASSGLGKEFALQIEREFFLDEIWLLARRVAPMNELIEKFQKSIGSAIEIDLTDIGDISAFQKRLENEKPEISILVNNAGYGKIGPFHELGLSEQLQMIDLNIRALTHMTKICLPFMKPGAKILQVASSAAFAPAPYFAVYAATKSYVVNFSEALNYELRELGIQVTAVCPGPVATEFFSVAQKNEFMKDKVGEAEPFNKFLMANAGDVVRKALQDMNRKKAKSIYGLPMRLLAAAAPMVPSYFSLRFLDRSKQR